MARGPIRNEDTTRKNRHRVAIHDACPRNHADPYPGERKIP